MVPKTKRSVPLVPKIDAISCSVSHKENVYTLTLTNADLEKNRSVKICGTEEIELELPAMSVAQITVEL